MRANPIRTRWNEGQAVINGWLGIESAFAAEIMAQTGFDSLTIDTQHGMIDYSGAAAMLQAISTTHVVPLVRVPWNDPGAIMKMLDAGAYGIICPMINSRSEAEAFVGAVRYPPAGYRSFGPRRAMLYAGSDYAQSANETLLAIVMIETRAAVDNLEEILSVPGVDGLYIGPADLSFSLTGRPGTDHTAPEMMAVIDHILITAQKYGVAPGIHTASPDYAQRMVEKGFRFVTVGSDTAFLESAARSALAALGQVREQRAASSPY